MRIKITPSLLLCLTAGSILFSCETAYHQQAYYTSPFNGSSESYHPIPLHTDSVRTALFVQGAGFIGSANDLETDHFAGGSVAASVAQHQGMWQWRAGFDLTAGSYTLGNWHSKYANNLFLVSYDQLFLAPTTAPELNAMSGPRTFAGAGFSGAVNAMIPMGQGEWRFLGIETALHQEFGDYLHFRRHLADSLATYIVRQPFFGTVGLTSEWVFRTTRGDFGFRLAYGWTIGAGNSPAGIYDSLSQNDLRFRYTSFSFHYTFDRYTIYVMGESGTKSASARLGFIYRLGRPRMPAKQIHRSLRTRPPVPRPFLPWPPGRRPDN